MLSPVQECNFDPNPGPSCALLALRLNDPLTLVPPWYVPREPRWRGRRLPLRPERGAKDLPVAKACLGPAI